MGGGFLSFSAGGGGERYSLFSLEEHLTRYGPHRDEHKRPLSGLLYHFHDLFSYKRQEGFSEEGSDTATLPGVDSLLGQGRWPSLS